MYTAYGLTDKTRKMLQYLFPPKYPEFIGHHITEQFGVPDGTPPPGEPVLVQVVGYIDNDDGVEGLLIEIDGTSDRPSGGKYHVTWSIDRSKGYKPFSTNKYVNEAKPISPIKIQVEPNVFK
jgi:hypothetical protein